MRHTLFENNAEIKKIYQNLHIDKMFVNSLNSLYAHPDCRGAADTGLKNLLFSLTISIRPYRILEIGAHVGTTTLILLYALRLNNYGKVFAIEPQEHFFNKLVYYVECAGLKDYLHAIKGFSTDPSVLEQLNREAPYDIIYIDAKHDKKEVVQELAIYYPMLVENGLFVLHDTSDWAMSLDTEKQGGVRSAIIEICNSYEDLNPIFLEPPLWKHITGMALIAKQKIINRGEDSLRRYIRELSEDIQKREREIKSLKEELKRKEEVISLYHSIIDERKSIMENMKGIASASVKLSTLIEKEDANPDLLCRMGEICFYLGLHRRAAALFYKALEKEPENTEILNNIGVLKTLQGDKTGAKEYFLRAIRLSSDFKEAQKNLAAIMEVNHPDVDSSKKERWKK